MQLSREIFSQYSDIAREIEMLERKKAETERSIAKLIEDGLVKDKVYGGNGGLQGYVVEGFPLKEYNRRRKLLRERAERLISRQNDLLELQITIEKEIDKIPESRDRLIFQGFFLENKSQDKIAKELYIDQSLVSRTIKKYFV
jgi:predicted transcriptional regulator